MVKILRKKGFILNPNDNIVNGLIKLIERNEGKCPCSGNDSTNINCPCSNYIEKDYCCCGLYKKEEA